MKRTSKEEWQFRSTSRWATRQRRAFRWKRNVARSGYRINTGRERDGLRFSKFCNQNDGFPSVREPFIAFLFFVEVTSLFDESLYKYGQVKRMVELIEFGHDVNSREKQSDKTPL